MLNLECAFNNLSFGFISYGVTYEFFKRNLPLNILPIANNADISSFDKVPNEYKQYLQDNTNGFLKRFKKDQPYLKIWHINGSWSRVSEPSYLLTFHELSELTDVEVNILNSYTKIFVTSTFSKRVFEDCGVKVPVVYVPMGFDSLHFKKTNKKYFDDGRITWLISGKCEFKRKRHKQAIQAWIKKFGNNRKHFLHLHIHNPFFKDEDMNKMYAEVFNGQKPPFNVQIFGYQATSALLNECYNVADIVIDMSTGESISIPSLTCVALGKHAIVCDCSGISDWSKFTDIVKIKPNGKEPAEDNIFFFRNSPFNSGNFYTWNTDDFIQGLDEVVKKFELNPINESGLVLQEEYSFKKGVDIMLKEINLN